MLDMNTAVENKGKVIVVQTFGKVYYGEIGDYKQDGFLTLDNCNPLQDYDMCDAIDGKLPLRVHKAPFKVKFDAIEAYSIAAE